MALRERVVVAQHRVDLEPGLGEDGRDELGVLAYQPHHDVLVEVGVAGVDGIIAAGVEKAFSRMGHIRLNRSGFDNLARCINRLAVS